MPLAAGLKRQLRDIARQGRPLTAIGRVQVPITTFSSFNDRLAPSHRTREHFIATVDLAEGPHRVPYAKNAWIRISHLDVTKGGVR